MKIHYEPHPVSPERKAELVADGFKIVDAKFAPAKDAQTHLDDAPQKRRGRTKKADA